MREVRREHEQLRAAAFEQATDIFGWIWRDTDLPAHELGGPHAQLAQATLRPAEGVDHDLHTFEPGGDPHGAELDYADLEPREFLQHVIEDERRQRHFNPMADGHVEEPREAFAATVEVRLSAPAVGAEAFGNLARRIFLDVEEDGDAGFFSQRVQRMQVRMRERVRRRGNRREREALDARVKGEARL